MKTAEIWKKDHILEYVAENIETFAIKYRDIKDKLSALPRSEHSKLMERLGLMEGGRKRNIKKDTSCIASMFVLNDVLGSKAQEHDSQIIIDGDNTLEEAAKEAAKMSRSFQMSGKMLADRKKEDLRKKYFSPTPPTIRKILGEEDIVAFVLPRLDEYDNLTQRLFSASKSKDKERFKELLSGIGRISENRLVIPDDGDASDAILLLEKISILRMLSETGSEHLQYYPESYEALDKANKRLNKASFDKYAVGLAKKDKSELKRVIEEALRRSRGHNDRNTLS